METEATPQLTFIISLKKKKKRLKIQPGVTKQIALFAKTAFKRLTRIRFCQRPHCLKPELREGIIAEWKKHE